MIRPMLAESADPAELDRYVQDDEWWLEQKLDGSRTLVVLRDGVAKALNRAGDPRAASLNLAAFANLGLEDAALDAEYLGGVLVVFDLPRLGKLIGPATAYAERRAVLEALFEQWKPDPAQVTLVPVARTTAEKQALVTAATEARCEGLMAKRASSLYVSGKRSAGWRKIKWTATVDCIVVRTGDGGKNSATLAVLDPDNDAVVEIGKASLNGKDPRIQIGSVVEVAYLNAGSPDAPRLYQPRIVGGARDDKAMSECLLGQLQFQSKEPVRFG